MFKKALRFIWSTILLLLCVTLCAGIGAAFWYNQNNVNTLSQKIEAGLQEKESLYGYVGTYVYEELELSKNEKGEEVLSYSIYYDKGFLTADEAEWESYKEANPFWGLDRITLEMKEAQEKGTFERGDY